MDSVRIHECSRNLRGWKVIHRFHNDVLNCAPFIGASVDLVGRRGSNSFQLFVSTAPVIRDNHIDDLFFFINRVEESPRTDSVTPCRWLPILKSFDVQSEVRLIAKLWINVFEKFGLNPLKTGSCNLL